MDNGGRAKVSPLHQKFLEGNEGVAMWTTGSDTEVISPCQRRPRSSRL